jgi:hypothetical protein
MPIVEPLHFFSDLVYYRKIQSEEGVMRRVLIVVGVILIIAAIAYARAPKSDYQWTGTVLESDGDHLVVQKGDEKWEFLQDKDTKVTGNLKVGSRVTVKYVMRATGIEVKEEAKKEEPKKADSKKK